MTSPANEETLVSQPRPETVFIVSQFQQANESFRLQLTLSVQIITVLVVANATIVGYGIAQRVAGILLIGPLFPLMIIVLVLVVRRFLTPVIYTVISLERRYGHPQTDWLGTTVFSVTVSPEFIEQLREISQIEDLRERTARLRKVKGPLIGTGRGLIRALLSVVAVAEVAVSLRSKLVLWQVFGWRMF